MRRTIILLALLSAVSCGNDSDIQKRYRQTAATQPAAAPPPPVAASTAKSAQVRGTDLREWNINDDTITVTFSYPPSTMKHVLTGKPKNDEKREYSLDGGAVMLEAKTKDEQGSFKLRTPSGALHWKVKIDGDKIKISDNEQNANAYEMRTKGLETKVLAPDGHTLGTVKFEDGRNVMRDGFDKTVDRMPSKFFRPAYGVLLIDGIDPIERYALLGELIERTR